MSWRTIGVLGPVNLTGNAERLEALEEARKFLKVLGLTRRDAEERMKHEKDHLFAFEDFEERSGKKLRLEIERGEGGRLRISIALNRLHIRKEVRSSLEAVDELSEGDLRFGCINKFRRR